MVVSRVPDLAIVLVGDLEFSRENLTEKALVMSMVIAWEHMSGGAKVEVMVEVME